MLPSFFLSDFKTDPVFPLLSLNTFDNYFFKIYFIQQFLNELLQHPKMCMGSWDFVSLSLSLLFALCVTQDSSEAEDLWQPDGHPGGFPVDCSLCQGGHGPAALLHLHYDQDRLHQLWVSKYMTNNSYMIFRYSLQGKFLCLLIKKSSNNY